jgi:hypothetical protein
MIIVVTGSRHWTNESQIKERMEELHTEAVAKGERLTIIHGGARGVDRMCAKWADIVGAKVIPEPAEWKPNGVFDWEAGKRRNIYMLEEYKPDRVEAFRAPGKSNGTDHCVEQAHIRGIEVEINHER